MGFTSTSALKTLLDLSLFEKSVSRRLGTGQGGPGFSFFEQVDFFIRVDFKPNMTKKLKAPSAILDSFKDGCEQILVINS